jgi:hypothetical protein
MGNENEELAASERMFWRYLAMKENERIPDKPHAAHLATKVSS